VDLILVRADDQEGICLIENQAFQAHDTVAFRTRLAFRLSDFVSVSIETALALVSAFNIRKLSQGAVYKPNQGRGDEHMN
jgi:hypothetical protein